MENYVISDFQENVAHSPDEDAPAEESEITTTEYKVIVRKLLTFVCGLCNGCFRRKKVLEEHMKICPKLSGFQNRKSKMLLNINQIVKECIEMEQKGECFCCGESYQTCHYGHIQCEHCVMSFKQQSSYERHVILIHAEEPNFPCETCNAKLRTACLLKLHLNQHEKFSQPFVCNLCSTEFSRRYTLTRHYKYHCPKNPSAKRRCRVCNTDFSSKDELKKHMVNHEGQPKTTKSYVECPSCKKPCASVAACEIHQRTHNGVKPYSCDLCDKKFSALGYLKTHRRTHLGEKPFICDICKISLSTKEVLGRHMKVHNGEKNHVCQECGKSFLLVSIMKKHLKRHILPFACPVCVRKFKTQRAWDRHFKEHKQLPLCEEPDHDPEEYLNEDFLNIHGSKADAAYEEKDPTSIKVV